MQYFKGNTHCHSTNSDGEISPAEVGEYYKAIGYDFLAITDHFHLTEPVEYSQPSGIAPLPGAEFGGIRLADTVGLWVNRAYERLSCEAFHDECPIGDVYQKNIDNILNAGGVPILCHPFWHWTFDYEKIKAVTGWKHFELCNASPDCNAMPIPGYAPAEAMWDKLLSNGQRVFGVASDDAHKYTAPYTPTKALGGRGFIMLKADGLGSAALRKAFEAGQFYSSTGAELKEYSLTENSIKVAVNITKDEEVCSFEFFGFNGELLQHSVGSEAEYNFRGDELYIRIRIATTTGHWLWTQPIFLDDLTAQMSWING
jgi:hypothetical protein